ncbi:MAG: DRTGG domain-containing protein [Acidobacteria bacterium]|nr:DRTGG domain-containing protein [Acidobacteriota bacterium]
MKIKDLAKKLKLKVVAGKDLLERDVKGGYCGDLLSDVLAGSKEGDIWLTVQVHPNIVAVSAMKGHCAVLITSSKKVEEETIEKAVEEKVAILSTDMNSFEAAGKISRLLENGG